MALLWQLLLELHRIGWRILGAAACSTTIAFLDELQKIPIAGRHFDLSESLLNAGSALWSFCCFSELPDCFPGRSQLHNLKPKALELQK